MLYKWFAHGGQEQKGDAGWSAEQVLVLSYKHHLITDGGASATGAAIVCAVLTATIPSQEEQGEPQRLGQPLSPAADQQPGSRH